MNYYIIAYIAAILTAISQILLKIGATRYSKSSIVKFYLNKFVISGYCIFFIVTLMNLFAYKFIDLKSYIFIYPATIVSVLLLSRIILHEEFDKKKYGGVAIVIIGIIIFNL